MKSVKHYPLSWFVDKIRKNEYFSLARFGDGEWLCILGKKGGNSHGCAYTEKLRGDLLDLLMDSRILKGMQRILPSQFSEIRSYMGRGDWVDTEIFGDSLSDGTFKDFFDAIREKNVIIVSSANKRAFPFYNHFIETPFTNTHEEKERIVKEILEYGKSGIYLFACGMAAGTIVAEVTGKIPRSFFLDIGHILDPFIGDKSREYLKHVPEEVLMQNI